jgi:hypothetical protein
MGGRSGAGTVLERMTAVVFVDAALHGSPGAVDLGSFSRSGLGQHGEQHDDPSCGDVVGDAGLLSAEVAAELSELPVELSGERLAEQSALVGQQVDVGLDVAELIVGEAVEPGGDLGFSSTGTPRHSKRCYWPVE